MKLLKELNEAEDNQYGVVQLGGSVGEKTVSSLRELKGKPSPKQTLSYEDAKEKAKQMNKQVSAGEKKHYGIKYVVAGVADGKFTGKGK